jgi:hypothetical protein
MKVTILRENEIRECVSMNKEAVDPVALEFIRPEFQISHFGKYPYGQNLNLPIG